MNQNTNYRLENIQNKEMKLRNIRQDILASDSEKALDLILDSPSPASLVQSFPDQDLYYLLHKIGGHDFTPVLSLARSDQWEYILDVEVWQNDRLDIEGMTRTFDLLFQADPQRLLRWAITQKPDYFEFYLFKNIDIFVREHDDIPPENFNDYITFDDKFYFRFPDKPETSEDEMPVPGDSQPVWELIEKMLTTLSGMDLSVYHGLMLETQAIIPAETEEEQFRLKTLRLAEKGFLPAHEAIGIYQPTQFSAIGKRPERLEKEKTAFDPDIPLPPQFFSQFFQGDNLFIMAIRQFVPRISLVIETELAALINKVISADKIKLRAKEDLEKSIKKTLAYLNLGLEVILDDKTPTAQKAKNIIDEYFLEDIFRTGSRAAIKLTTLATQWFKKSYMNKNNLPLSFLGEHYLGVMGGLFLDRPLYFDNYATGELYRNFTSLVDIKTTRTVVDQVIALDSFIEKLNPDISSFTQGLLTYKTLTLTLWSKSRLNLSANLDPIPVKTFKPFFSALFSQESTDKADQTPLNDLVLWAADICKTTDQGLDPALKTCLANLMDELEDEYSQVDSANIDTRFISHFLLK